MKFVKRSAPPPRDPENRQTIEALVVAVNELTGAVGSPAFRALRVVDMLDSGVLSTDENGRLVSSKLAELESRIAKLEGR